MNRMFFQNEFKTEKQQPINKTYNNYTTHKKLFTRGDTGISSVITIARAVKHGGELRAALDLHSDRRGG